MKVGDLVYIDWSNINSTWRGIKKIKEIYNNGFTEYNDAISVYSDIGSGLFEKEYYVPLSKSLQKEVEPYVNKPCTEIPKEIMYKINKLKMLKDL